MKLRRIIPREGLLLLFALLCFAGYAIGSEFGHDPAYNYEWVVIEETR